MRDIKCNQTEGLGRDRYMTVLVGMPTKRTQVSCLYTHKDIAWRIGIHSLLNKVVTFNLGLNILFLIFMSTLPLWRIRRNNKFPNSVFGCGKISRKLGTSRDLRDGNSIFFAFVNLTPINQQLTHGKPQGNWGSNFWVQIPPKEFSFYNFNWEGNCLFQRPKSSDKTSPKTKRRTTKKEETNCNTLHSENEFINCLMVWVIWIC